MGDGAKEEEGEKQRKESGRRTERRRRRETEKRSGRERQRGERIAPAISKEIATDKLSQRGCKKRKKEGVE